MGSCTLGPEAGPSVAAFVKSNTGKSCIQAAHSSHGLPCVSTGLDHLLKLLKEKKINKLSCVAAHCDAAALVVVVVVVWCGMVWYGMVVPCLGVSSPTMQ